MSDVQSSQGSGFASTRTRSSACMGGGSTVVMSRELVLVHVNVPPRRGARQLWRLVDTGPARSCAVLSCELRCRASPPALLAPRLPCGRKRSRRAPGASVAAAAGAKSEDDEEKKKIREIRAGRVYSQY